MPDIAENGPKNLDDLCGIPEQTDLWKAKIYIQLESVIARVTAKIAWYNRSNYTHCDRDLCQGKSDRRTKYHDR
jgi:hypothetical protein